MTEALVDTETEVLAGEKPFYWPNAFSCLDADKVFFRGRELKNDENGGFVFYRNDEFFRLTGDGTEKYLGVHRCSSWEIRSERIILHRETKYFEPDKVGSFCLHDNGKEEPLS